MASTIITKNSSTATAVPAVGDLQQGELAVNVTDKKVYTKDSSAAIVKVVGSLGNQEANAVAITGGTVTGITDLAVADGGTGASTAAGALNNLLPSQTSNANKYLQTDGTNATWDAISISTADITGTLPVLNGGTGVTSSTGTGNVVLSNSPTLVTPALGTPASGVATNITGLPISTGVSGLGTGVATFLGTPSSANLASAVTDETGSGALVFATSPTLVTPALGTPSALVGTNITGTASGLTAGNVTTNANLTGAVTSVGNATSLGSFTSAQLATALTDETGSGANVFATSPTLVTPILGTPTSATLTNATGLPLTTGVTGTLPTANGGTNLTSFTSGGVVYASSTSALATGSALTFDGTILSSTRFAGALNGTVGATTATTGAFTSVTASTTLGVTGVSTLTGGAQVTGSISGYGGGEVRLGPTTSAAASAISTQATGAPTLDFAHRGTSNTGTFNWLNGTGASSLLMTLTSTGLGIGTSSPAQKLHINGNDQSNVRIRLTNTGTAGVNWDLIGGLNGASNAFFSIFNVTSSKNALVIDASNNLGVGIAPQAKLNVQYTDSAPTASGTMVSGAVFQYATGGVALNMGSSSSGYSYFNSAFANNAGVGSAYRFYQGATQAMTLDADGDLGIGTTSPAYKLHVVGSVRLGPAGNDTYIGFGANADNYFTCGASGIQVFRNSSGTERARIPAAGGIQSVNSISVGDATPSTSGAGITFPATQSASSDANTLDDYEEGTWTPNQGAGLTVVGTFSSSGTYTKVGRLVTLTAAYAATTSLAITAGGVLSNNLPFSGPAGLATTGGISANGTTDNGVVVCASAIAYSAFTFTGKTSLFFSITYIV